MAAQAEEAPLMLSVSGARGIAGVTMTAETAARYGAAVASELRATAASGTRPKVVVGRDGRASGEWLAPAAAAGLRACGCDVDDIGICATPTVAVMIGKLGAHGGLMCTASHNPIEWNGIKALDRDGLAPPPEAAARIIARFRSGDLAWERGDSRGGAISAVEGADRTHVERVLANVDVAAIAAARIAVTLDSVNGGGAASGRMLLEALGCDIVHLNWERTGTFAHTPEPTERNLRDMAAAVEARARAMAGDGRMLVGFAQDPDADRLAIIDERGRYIGEECTLALCARRILMRSGPVALAANLSTSRMIDDIAAQVPGASVTRSAVGEANVVAAMRASGATIGGEGNGGVIWPPICLVRDSLSAMALVLELMAIEGKPVSSLVSGLPAYAMVKRTLDLSAVGGTAAVPALLRAVADTHASAAGATVSTLDGVRIDVPQGWVHFRASNTEPIMRIIAEGRTPEDAMRLARDCAASAGLTLPE
jgi:phosphomannomutase